MQITIQSVCKIGAFVGKLYTLNSSAGTSLSWCTWTLWWKEGRPPFQWRITVPTSRRWVTLCAEAKESVKLLCRVAPVGTWASPRVCLSDRKQDDVSPRIQCAALFYHFKMMSTNECIWQPPPQLVDVLSTPCCYSVCRNDPQHVSRLNHGP